VAKAATEAGESSRAAVIYLALLFVPWLALGGFRLALSRYERRRSHEVPGSKCSDSELRGV